MIGQPWQSDIGYPRTKEARSPHWLHKYIIIQRGMRPVDLEAGACGRARGFYWAIRAVRRMHSAASFAGHVLRMTSRYVMDGCIGLV